MQIEFRENTIRFKDISNIDQGLWQKMLNRINYLGYEIPDTNALAEYFGRGVWLNPDQALEVRRVLNLMPDIQFPDDVTVKQINHLAVKEFGKAYRYKVAGYILTDGTLLAMTYDGFSRNIDHREIRRVVLGENESQSAPMYAFMSLGNIRLITSGISLMRPMTNIQRKMVRNYILECQDKNEIYFTIDIINPAGTVVKGIRHEFGPLVKTDPDMLLKEIDDYFESIKI